MKSNTDVAILFVFGQSNAYAHGTRLKEEEKINTPLKNVFGLDAGLNRKFGLTDVVWSGFVSHGMNFGAGEDDTCSISNILAKKWQSMIDGGKKLPDLYIVQISTGGQGIDAVEKNNENMWYMGMEKVINLAPWPEGRISLYPMAMEVLPLAMKSIKAKFKSPEVIGVHWNQWETEASTGGHAIENAKDNYAKLFASFKEAIGEDYTLYLYKPLSQVYDNPPAVEALDALFKEMEEKNSSIHVIDITKSSFYDDKQKTQGIFQEDCVHYNDEAHEWFADYQLKQTF